MAKTLTQELPFDDINKTAAALLLFWREYRTEFVLPKGTRLKFERWRDEQSLIEYHLSGYVSAYTGQPEGSVELGHSLFHLELVSMPNKRQEIRFHNVSKPDNSITLSPLLSDDEIDNFFNSFLKYLRDRGHLSNDPDDKFASAYSLEPEADSETPQKSGSPEKPAVDAPRDEWFDYYHACKEARIRYTFNDMEEDIHSSAGYLRQLHMRYMLERGSNKD